MGCWGDDEAVVWGMLLSDVARHIAEMLEKQQGPKKAESLAKIREHFNAELDSPTPSHLRETN
jgi:hypothetical protein